MGHVFLQNGSVVSNLVLLTTSACSFLTMTCIIVQRPGRAELLCIDDRGRSPLLDPLHLGKGTSYDKQLLHSQPHQHTVWDGQLAMG